MDDSAIYSSDPYQVGSAQSIGNSKRKSKGKWNYPTSQIPFPLSNQSLVQGSENDHISTNGMLVEYIIGLMEQWVLDPSYQNRLEQMYNTLFSHFSVISSDFLAYREFLNDYEDPDEGLRNFQKDRDIRNRVSFRQFPILLANSKQKLSLVLDWLEEFSQNDGFDGNEYNYYFWFGMIQVALSDDLLDLYYSLISDSNYFDQRLLNILDQYIGVFIRVKVGGNLDQRIYIPVLIGLLSKYLSYSYFSEQTSRPTCELILKIVLLNMTINMSQLVNNISSLDRAPLYYHLLEEYLTKSGRENKLSLRKLAEKFHRLSGVEIEYQGNKAVIAKNPTFQLYDSFSEYPSAHSPTSSLIGSSNFSQSYPFAPVIPEHSFRYNPNISSDVTETLDQTTQQFDPLNQNVEQFDPWKLDHREKTFKRSIEPFRSVTRFQ